MFEVRGGGHDGLAQVSFRESYFCRKKTKDNDVLKRLGSVATVRSCVIVSQAKLVATNASKELVSRQNGHLTLSNFCISSVKRSAQLPAFIQPSVTNDLPGLSRSPGLPDILRVSDGRTTK